MKFKYSEKINLLGISNCPPNECRAVEDDGICYRWVHEDIEHRNNFIPVLAINPKRIHTPAFSEDDQKCSGFALSMYDTFNNSRNEYLKILRKNANFAQFVGTHVAKLTIYSGDGFKTPPSRKGHFDLFEREELNLIERISEIFEIK